jgi:cytochrome c-type biogenesis protein CcsB
MDPTRQLLDQILLSFGLAAYVGGALALFAYFLAAAADAAHARAAARDRRLRRAVRRARRALVDDRRVAADEPVRLALAVQRLRGADLPDLRLSLRSALIGGPVLGLAAIALGYATTWNEGYMPAVPALQSYWIKIHVPIVIGAYASFMVAFCVSLIYLLKLAAESHYRSRATLRAVAAAPGGARIDVTRSKYAASTPAATGRIDTPAIADAAARRSFAAWLAGLPSLARLDVMQYRIIAVGLPLLSLGIITGAMWANEAWGAYWQWDPKETAALFSWIVYASYMHLHTRPEWRGPRTTLVSVFGFVSILFCYLGVNIWISGLHSYKM